MGKSNVLFRFSAGVLCTVLCALGVNGLQRVQGAEVGEDAIPIDEKVFPDGNFRNYISEKIDTDGDGSLSSEEIVSCTKIDCSHSGISDLKGIESFTSLSYLDCSQNQLTSLDLGGNEMLEKLYCYSDGLDSLDVTNNPRLNELSCFNNDLSSLDITHNPELVSLDCDKNNLTFLDVSRNDLLKNLECENNAIVDLSLKDNKLLQSLSCCGNELDNLYVGGNLFLKKLVCFDNKLKELDITKNDQLEEISCGWNNLSSLDVSKNVSLVFLDCRSNSLKSLNLSDNKGLKSLYCDNNRLENLDISNNKDLEVLGCSANHLEKLDLDNNSSLISLDCSDTRLEKLDISKATELKKLWCDNNRLADLNIDNNNDLAFLSCDDNDLEKIAGAEKLKYFSNETRIIQNKTFLSEMTNNNSVGDSSLILKEAQEKYNVSKDTIFYADTPEMMIVLLEEAGTLATEEKPFIVYVKEGIYKIPRKLTVPENVILVCEKETEFVPEKEENFTQFFTVFGNICGGTYECNDMAYYGLRFADVKFQGNNGTIEKAFVKNSKRAGIVAIGSKTRYARALDNYVSGCGNSGISSLSGACMSEVSGNKCRNNRSSGINLGHADISKIKDNDITGNTGHGISTDTDREDSNHRFCHINILKNNVITGNGKNGVYMDKNCFVDEIFLGNRVIENGLNGLSIRDKAYIDNFNFNIFDKNGASNINVNGNAAFINIGNKNKLTNAGTNNISISKGGIVTLYGNNNVISDSANNGISINSGSGLFVTGKGTAITDNYNFGIRIAGKSRAILGGITFINNGVRTIKIEEGSTVTTKK